MPISPALAEHAFIQTVFTRAQPLLTQVFKDRPKKRSEWAAWQAKNRSRLTQADRYCMDVMERIHNLLRVFGRLEHSRVLLRRSPSGFSSTRHVLDRGDWVDYHFAFFSTSLSSIADCAVLLTAEVYQLGLPPKSCTLELITTHHWIKGSPVVKALKALHKSVEPHKHRRNRYLHRGEEADFGELTDPEFLSSLRTLTWLDARGYGPSHKEFLREGWSEALRDLSPRLQRAVDETTRRAQEVLAALEAHFSARDTLLSQVERLQSGSASGAT